MSTRLTSKTPHSAWIDEALATSERLLSLIDKLIERRDDQDKSEPQQASPKGETSTTSTSEQP